MIKKIKSLVQKVFPPVLYGKLYTGLMPIFYDVEMIFCQIRYFFRFERLDYLNIPIIINNYNRYSFLVRLINSLEKRGFHNIIIIDNNSTYPPLLDFYKTCKYEVILLHKNVGYKSIWETGIYDRFKHSYYVYTDSDMEIDEDCPNDFMEKFVMLLNRHVFCQKVGFGIRIDDLPECYKFKKDVIRFESPYWIKKAEEGVFYAPIDTTFALYRPYTGQQVNHLRKTLRTGFPYVIRHLPWYLDSDNMNSEEKYYVNSIQQSTEWSKKNKK